MNNVLFVQDYNFLNQDGGGAEISDSLIFTYGVSELKYDIDLMTPQNIFTENIESYDITIISNATGFPQKTLLEIMEKSKKVIFYDHDQWSHCKWRLFYPQIERCRTTCPVLPFSKKFYEHVDGIVWLSPIHRKSTLFALPELESKQHLLMPSPIITEPFTREYPDIERIPNTVIANNVVAFKGEENALDFCRRHREMKFTFIGAEGELSREFPSNVSFIGKVPHNTVAKLMHAHECVMELPDTIQPFERFIAEGMLAGCQPIINDNVGVMSYEWIYDDIEKTAVDCSRLEQEVTVAPKKFWKFCEKI